MGFDSPAQLAAAGGDIFDMHKTGVTVDQCFSIKTVNGYYCGVGWHSLGVLREGNAGVIEKYNNLAREALANEDKILSENYFQHADHFTRILGEQEKNKSIKSSNETIKTVVNNEKSSSDLNDKKEPENQIANS